MSRATSLHQAFWRRHLLRPFLVLLVVNALVFVAYTLPRRMQERSVNAQLLALRAEAEAERRAVAELREQAETYQSNLRDSERFYQEVVGRRRSLVEVLGELGRMASDLGLQPGRRTYTQGEVTGAPLVEFGINMPVSGSYKQLVSLLARLERSPRFLTVESLKLREKQGEQRADLSLELSAYFRAEGREGP